MAEASEPLPSTPQEFSKALKLKDLEIENLKGKMALMEMELAEAQKLKTQKNKQAEEVQVLKTQSENILTKAKAMIFENTKIIKNQELQIEALGQQNESLRDVVRITKDLLEIRNMEVKQLEEKIDVMDKKVMAEKERQDLLHKKLETMIRHNGELKREYETQLCLFSSLREKYNQKNLAEGIVTDLRQEVLTARAEQEKTLEETASSQEDPPKTDENSGEKE
ncbi:hyaluronan mediated motility receptor [Euwallacea fornicatus]|uniref:hyaluronan mediated motility receptor n=1 Tax=Euwallacea fornicatus TaxID=995702 RepID=UPI00338E62DF